MTEGLNQALLASTSPDVLLNKGFPAQFVKTKPDASGVYQPHPKKELTTHHVMIDNERLFAIEARWGTLEKWETGLATNVVTTVVGTLGIVLGWPEQRVLKSMRFGGITEYSLAIRGAYAMSLGRDPKVIKQEMMNAGGDPETVQTHPETDPDSSSWEPTDDSTGPSFGDVGLGTDTTPSDSGASPWDSSSPTSSQWQ